MRWTITKACFLAGLATMSLALAACGEAPHAKPAAAANVVLLSDIHFDPFRDPSKFARLATADVNAWPKIFAEPDAANAATLYAAVETACPSRGQDTPWDLLHNSLRAAHERTPHPTFVTISGDLMEHQFACRYKAVGGDPALYSNFSAKTAAFVVAQVHESFASAPVFAALGNNDSGCGDYREAVGSDFLKAEAAAFAEATGKEDRGTFADSYSSQGDAVVTLPLHRSTRLIVLQDVFQSAKYSTCAGASDPAPAAMQIAWLRKQLQAARSAGDVVWVMGHVPTGVDLYSTTTSHSNVCNGDAPAMYLRDDAMDRALREYADIVKLAIFAHSHMDEMRALRGKTGVVPVKLVPSISPVNGNKPSFTVGEVDTDTATLKDYAVYVSSKADGAGDWKLGYDFHELYKQPEFSGATVAKLVDGFAADPDGSSELSQAYRFHFWAGDSGLHAIAFGMVWKSFACATAVTGADEYRNCLCGDAAATK